MTLRAKQDMTEAHHSTSIQPHIAVVIPAYQEERLLPITLQSLPDQVRSIIVVDDASTDATRARALDFAQQAHYLGTHRVRILTLHENSGVGRAICIGYLEALGLGADIAVVMGADAQMDPKELCGLVDALSDEVAYVKGDRMNHPEVRKRMPHIRYWGNRCLSCCTGVLMGFHKLSDAQCGYTALDLRWLSKIPLAHLYPRYGFPNDLLLRLQEEGAQISQVQVTPIYATEQSKLSIPKVILPILGVFIRAIVRKLLIYPLSR